MAIYRKDGTPYQPGQMQQLNPDSNESTLFNQWSQELIKMGGSPILYYEFFIPPSTIDPLYTETRSGIWSEHPIELHALYEPAGSQMYMNTFGIDGPDTQVFTCNYQDVLAKLGHLPTIGARIFTPHLRENWEVRQYKLSNFYKWKVYVVEIHCIKFQESLTVQEGKVTKNSHETGPDFKIDE